MSDFESPGKPPGPRAVVGQAVVGQVVGPVEVGPIAHGGHCVARHVGRVIFVRHALPGESVRVRLTDTTHDRFWRGDAVEVIRAAADRVAPSCPVSGPGGCGGCDFQHVSDAGELELKRAVVAEQLQRLAGVIWGGVVEPVEPVRRWRTRMRYVTTGVRAGAPFGLGLRAHRSTEVVALPEQGCEIAAVPAPRVEADQNDADQRDELSVVDAASGRVAICDGELLEGDDRTVVERCLDREFEVDAEGFWQVHAAAAGTLVDAVLAGLSPHPGERGFDLYCGVGLFTAALAEAGVTMWGVESDKTAVSHARRNVREARFTSGLVDRALAKLPRSTDVVVLDPPRSGAGRTVLRQIFERTPRAVAYVACDPSALGRDLGYAADLGWEPASIRAFNLFPRTHHVECVAILRPQAKTGSSR